MTEQQTPRDRASRAYSVFLQRLGRVKAGDIAKQMDISDSTLSEIKNRQVEQCLTLLAHLGLKVVDANARCMSPSAFAFATEVLGRAMKSQPQLVWDEGE